jgi:hypothetical protein
VKVLIVNAHPSRMRLCSSLRLPRSQVVAVRTLNQALIVAAVTDPGVIVVAARSVGPHLARLLAGLHQAMPCAVVVVVHGDVGCRDDACTCFRAGAAHYVDWRDRDLLRPIIEAECLRLRAMRIAAAFHVLASVVRPGRRPRGESLARRQSDAHHAAMKRRIRLCKSLLARRGS